jgi:hypothetical protein
MWNGVGRMVRVYTRFCWKVPGLGQNCWLSLLNFGCHHYQNSLLGNIYSDPIIFFHASKALWKSFSLMLSSAACSSLWMSDTFKTLSLQFYFQFGKQGKITGTKSREWGGWDMITMLFLVTNCGFQGRAGMLLWWSRLWLHPSSGFFMYTHVLSSVSEHHSKSQIWP